MLIAFVFPLELIATILPSARDTLGGTTLGLFTISWLTFGWVDRSAPAGSTSVAVGVYLGGYEQQLERLEAEAGVRQQL